MERGAYETMAATEGRHWWFVGRRSIIRHLLQSLRLDAGVRIAELGAGTGGNLKMLAEFGRVDAMEMDDGARAG